MSMAGSPGILTEIDTPKYCHPETGLPWLGPQSPHRSILPPKKYVVVILDFPLCPGIGQPLPTCKCQGHTEIFKNECHSKKPSKT